MRSLRARARGEQSSRDAGQHFPAIGRDEEPHEWSLHARKERDVYEGVDQTEQESVKKLAAGQSATDPERAEETEDHSS